MPKKSAARESTSVTLKGHPLSLLRSEIEVATAAHGVRPSGSAMAAALIQEAVVARNNARAKKVKP